MKQIRTQNQVRTDRMIAKTKAKVRAKLEFPGISPASLPRNSPVYWTHRFPAKAFRENLNVTSYYAEDAMVLQIYLKFLNFKIVVVSA